MRVSLNRYPNLAELPGQLLPALLIRAHMPPTPSIRSPCYAFYFAAEVFAAAGFVDSSLYSAGSYSSRPAIP